MNIQVVDDFLEPYEHKAIYDRLMGEDVAWFYSDGVDYPQDGKFQLVHFFYWNHDWKSDASCLSPILDKLNPYAISKMKANMLTPTKEIELNDWHTDIDNDKFTTCIYYVNDNDGYTEFEDGSIIESKANRFVMFNSGLKHRGTTSTERRIVINLNFILADGFRIS